jgi:hypothetical protein
MDFIPKRKNPSEPSRARKSIKVYCIMIYKLMPNLAELLKTKKNISILMAKIKKDFGNNKPQ